MKVLHIAPLEAGRITGPGAVIPRLVEEQNRGHIDAECRVLSSLNGDPISLSGAIYYIWPEHKSALEWVVSDGASQGIVVFHGVYAWKHWMLAIKCKILGINYIIVPHGNLMQASTQRSRLRKRFALMTVCRWFVMNAAALQFLNSGERDNSVLVGRSSFLVGNGVDVASNDENHDQTGRGDPPGGVRFMFLGRLDVFHKGLDLLLDAVALSKSEFAHSGASLIVIGPDHKGGLAQIKQMIQDYELSDYVELSPSLVGERKVMAMKSADVFVHTSRLEGEPMAVLEALALGLPCILTRETNLGISAAQHEAGWCVDADPHSIASAFSEVLNHPDRLPMMSEHAAHWMRKEHSWEEVARKSLDSYRDAIS